MLLNLRNSSYANMLNNTKEKTLNLSLFQPSKTRLFLTQIKTFFMSVFLYPNRLYHRLKITFLGLFTICWNLSDVSQRTKAFLYASCCAYLICFQHKMSKWLILSTVYVTQTKNYLDYHYYY